MEFEISREQSEDLKEEIQGIINNLNYYLRNKYYFNQFAMKERIRILNSLSKGIKESLNREKSGEKHV